MPGKLTKADAETFWQCADKDGNGELTIGELKRAVGQYCSSQGRPIPDDRSIVRMFQGIDRGGDNKISKDEFMKEMTEREEREATFCKLFKQLDKDGNGTLSRDEIKQLFQLSNCKYNAKQIEEIINDSDKNGDGVIQYEEFKNECT